MRPMIKELPDLADPRVRGEKVKRVSSTGVISGARLVLLLSHKKVCLFTDQYRV